MAVVTCIPNLTCDPGHIWKWRPKWTILFIVYPVFWLKEQLQKVLKTLKVFLYFPVMLFNMWTLRTCLQEILIQCSNTHALYIGLRRQPLNCQRLGTWWRPPHDEGSNRLAPRLLIPCARCLPWSLEQMLGPQNYWRNQWLPRKQTQFYIIEQLFRFFCSLFFPLLFFLLIFFFWQVDWSGSSTLQLLLLY